MTRLSPGHFARVAAPISTTALALIALLIAAFAVRVYRLDWDEGRLLHPDELHVVDVTATRIEFSWPPDVDNLLDPETSKLNPRSDDPDTGLPRQYAYGALPVLVTDLTATLLSEATGTDWTSYFGRLHKIGRALSALFDTGTAALIFLLGRRLFAARIGLLAATFYALAPMTIQLAHFFTTDSWVTFFAALTLLLSAHAAESGRLAAFAGAGAAFGLAMASKGSVIALSLVIAVAAGWVAREQTSRGESPSFAAAGLMARLTGAGAAALVMFGLFEPYALARPGVYLDQLRIQSGIVRGALDVAFTRQYAGTTPFVYQFEQLVLWAVGPATTLLALVGVGIWSRQVWRRPRGAHLAVLCWLAVQGAIVTLPETKFIRYLAPILPDMVIAAALAFDRARLLIQRRAGARVAGAAAAASLAVVFLWCAGFSSIYAAPHTRLEASRWIYERVPNGSKIGVETWDETLPVIFGTGLTPWDYQYALLPIELYRDRPPETVAEDLYRSLEQIDYLIVSSNRVERGVRNLPWRYPVQIAYYDALEQGDLGFQLVASFEREPGVGGLSVDDSAADESLLNYDHPRVRVYQKTSLIERARFDALMARATAQPFEPDRSAPASLMLDEPVSDLAVVNDARWSQRVTGNSGAALIAWVVFLSLLWWTGKPLARAVFGRFADGGASLARLLTLLLGGYVVWIAASLHLIAFRALWASAAIGVVALLSFLAARRGLTRPPSADQRRSARVGEAVFWTTFGLFLLFRWINPDSWHPYWGGEKPMEFAHLNAILRSAHFPPYDPWFADGYINYYYYGEYLVAFCMKVTGIPSEIAFNLAQPTVIALLAAAGYSVAATIARGLTRGGGSGIAGGLGGVALLVAAGNLEAARQVVRAFPESLTPTFGGLTWTGSRVIPFTINEFPYFTGLYADLHAHVVAMPIGLFVVACCLSLALGRREWLSALSSGRSARQERQRLIARFGVLIVALGALFPTNAWDVPVFAALTVVAIFMASAGLPSMAFRIALTGAVAAVTAALAYLLYYPFHSHYVALFGSLERTREPTPLWPFLDHFGGLLAIGGAGLVAALISRKSVATQRVELVNLLAVALVAILIAIGVTNRGGDDVAPLLTTALTLCTAAILVIAGWTSWSNRGGPAGSAAAIAALLGLSTLFTIMLVADQRYVLALMIAFAGAGVALWSIGDAVAARFAGALIAAGASVTAGVELVYLADDLIGTPWYRMNTVFKFYNQVWLLLALAGGALIALLIDRARLSLIAGPSAPLGLVAMSAGEPVSEPVPPPRTDEPAARSRALWARGGLVIAGLVLVASLAYPLLATRPRLQERFPNHPSPNTLDALDWMSYGEVATTNGAPLRFDEDRAVIDWFNDEIAGSPVIAEASIGPYRCNGSRVSIATGLPTIIGWLRHQTQQRYLDGLSQREADVQTLYASTDLAEKRAILRRYDVRYVVVGDLERRYPAISGNDCVATDPRAGIDAFTPMIGSDLEVAFQAGETVVFRVLPVVR